MRAAILHPDLGIGGAERLIVDATCAVIDRGYQTEVFTSYYDKQRCFEETKGFSIIVLGQWIPRSIMGRFRALMAYIKMIYIATYLVITRRNLDLIICDQVSACIPILKLGFGRSKIIFYCHFPDQLLTSRETLIKAIYRKPLDWLEEWSTNFADVILVNSHFTSRVVRKLFRSLDNRDLTVIHPCVRTTKLGKNIYEFRDKPKDIYLFLSLNRFEEKKNIGLAIHSLHECLARGHSMKAHLIIAGGYDERLTECVRYKAELENLVERLGLNSRVVFVESPDDHTKDYLIQLSDAVLYTPENEHFGIVPLEAMMFKKPVVASASGGPLETILPGVTGILCDARKEDFADAMCKLMSNPQLGVKMGEAGLKRVQKHFSFEAFSYKLQTCASPSEY